jgi:predicted ester cyclase
MELVDADRIVRRIFVEGINNGDFAGVAEHVSDSYVDHSPIPAAGPGPDGFAGRIKGLKAAFADLSIEINDLAVSNDRIWFRWTQTGHHSGPFAGLEPTGRQIRVEGINLEVMDGEKVVEHFSLFDRLGLMHQLNPPPTK